MSAPDPIDFYLFDIGNVLIRWDPERLLLALFNGDSSAVRRFVEAIDLWDLIAAQDGGASPADIEARVARDAPDHLAVFQAYERRWLETIDGIVPETAAFLRALRRAGRPVYALSNYARDHLARSEPHYPVLREFDGRLISAQEGLLKPDPAIYQRATERFDLTPARTFFIDDRPENIETARALGFRAHCFDWRAPHRLAEALPAEDAALYRRAIDGVPS